MTDTSRIDNGRGVGLRNTRERLQVMYGKEGTIECTNISPGLRIELQFPTSPTEHR
jgi:hypothetical protein